MKLTKKQQKQLFSIGITVILILLTVLGLLPSTQQPSPETSTTVEVANQFSTFVKQQKYPLVVERVIDGDTIQVKLNHESVKVRLLLIDTPETAKEGKTAQPFAEEAKERTSTLLQNAKTIEGAFDIGNYTDKYGRALMYVYIDGKLLQEQLVEESLARVGYAYPPNTTLLKDLQVVEAKAKKQKKKIWEKDYYTTNKGFNPDVY